MKAKFPNKIFVILFSLGFIIRIAGSFLLGSQDVEWWKAWSKSSVTEGVLNIYGEQDKRILPLIGHKPFNEINEETRKMISYDSFRYKRKEFQYIQPPLFIYFLSATGEIYHLVNPGMANSRIFIFFNNLIPLAASTLIAVAIYLFVKKIRSEQDAEKAALLFWLNPLILLNSPILGYQDMACAFFAVASVILAYKKNTLYSYIFLALSLMTKPQGALIAPVIFLAGMKDIGWKKNLLASLSAPATALLVSAPFIFSNHGLRMIISVLSVKDYVITQLSSEALNLWWLYQDWFGPKIIHGNLDATILGIKAVVIGLCLFIAFTVLNLRNLWQNQNKERESIILAAGFAIFGYYMLQTGVLSNHYFLMVPIFALLAIFQKRYLVLYMYISIFFFIQDFIFCGFGRDYNHLLIFLRNNNLEKLITDILALINVAFFSYFSFVIFKRQAPSSEALSLKQ